MILFDTSKCLFNPNTIRIIFLNLLQARLKNNPNLYNLKTIEKLIEDNHIPSVRYLFDIIQLDRDGNISFEDYTDLGRVLRYIEYGGELIKPTHILQDTVRDLNNIIY